MARKPVSTSIENNLLKATKKLAIDLERPFNELLEEALGDLLAKYEKAEVMYSLPDIPHDHPKKK